MINNDEFPDQVSDETGDSKKRAFIDFKWLVWHRAFHCIIKSLIEKSKWGGWLQDNDGIAHHYFPGITILSADYEEQHVLYYYSQLLLQLTPMYGWVYYGSHPRCLCKMTLSGLPRPLGKALWCFKHLATKDSGVHERYNQPGESTQHKGWREASLKIWDL